MSAYLLTEAADADLRNIIRYTRNQWNDEQVRRYIAKLEKGIGRLAAGEQPFKNLSAVYPALRVALCENHYVFCLARDAALPLIVAIFHERMDLITRLGDRLGASNDV